MTSENIKQEKNNFLSVLKDFAFVSAVYLYFIGWIYSYYYLNSFGVSIRQADIEIYSVIIYSTGVFGYYIDSFLFWVILLLIILGTCLLYRVAVKKRKDIVLQLFLPLILIALFPILFYTARMAGTKTASADKNPTTSTLSRINVIFNKEFLKFDSGNIGDSSDYRQKLYLYKVNKSGQLLLLLSSKDEYLCLKLGQLPVIYSIKKENIDYAYIYKN